MRIEGVEPIPEASNTKDSELDFFGSHRAFFDHYAGDRSLNIQSARGVQTAEGPLDTFAIDLESGTIYVCPEKFRREGETNEGRVLFGTCHEIEHFRELRGLLRETSIDATGRTVLSGPIAWERHRARTESKQRLHILDNCIDDIKINRSVVERAPVLAATERGLYTDTLFPALDYTQSPRHLQLVYALLREARVPDQRLTLDPEVRTEVDRIQSLQGKSGQSYMDITTSPATAMSLRLALQEAVIEPVYERFFAQDVVDRSKAESEKPKAIESGKPGETGEGNPGEPGDKNEEAGDKIGDGKPGDTSEESGNPDEKPGDTKKSPGGKEGEPKNPEEYFQGEYDEYFKKNKHAIDEGDIDKAVEEEVKRIRAEVDANDPRKQAEEALKKYAEANGVTVPDLKNYRKFKAQLETLKNSETGEVLIEELRGVFRRIVTERTRQLPAPLYPVVEGDEIVDHAGVIAAVHAGDLEPAVWEVYDTREKKSKQVGSFNLRLVADLSGSMAEGGKATAQRVAMMLCLEALTEFQSELADLNANLTEPLTIQTAVHSFGDTATTHKPLGAELTERDRVETHRALQSPDGNSTRDYLVLNSILATLTPDDEAKLKEGKVRDIVVVMTDGESSDVAQTKRITAELRAKGLVVVAIGVLKEGAAAVTTYAHSNPGEQGAIVCESVERLPAVLGELLQKYLETV
jgi:hypothetical protein